MRLESGVFNDTEEIPHKYTFRGDNINPPLEIFDVPEGAKSLVLIMDNHDSEDPSGEKTQWVVWNIDPATRKIPKNSVPKGAIVGKNSFGKTGYMGPKPLTEHLYRFRLYALDTRLEINPKSSPGDVIEAMHGHKMDKAVLTGYCEQEISIVI